MELFSVCTLKVYYQTFGVQITCESHISVYTKKYNAKTLFTSSS